MRAMLVVLAVVGMTAVAHAEPRNYWGADFRASATLPVVGTYDYLGGDAFAGLRVRKWLAFEAHYGFDLGQGAYGYPAGCSQMCCGSQLRSWQMQEVGARAVFVPLHASFIDVSAGLGVAAVLAREDRESSPGFGMGAQCYSPFIGFHGAFAASTFVSVELRPTRAVGVRLSGLMGVADISDWPMFQLAAGPVFWF
jgi:hypothetical protein